MGVKKGSEKLQLAKQIILYFHQILELEELE